MRAYYGRLLREALGRKLWQAGNDVGIAWFFVSILASFVVAVVGLANADAAAYLTRTFSSPLVALIPSLILLVAFLLYGLLAQNYENLRGASERASAADRARSALASEVEALKDQLFWKDAPLLRWQTPEVRVVNGALEFRVQCTNEGGQSANVKSRVATWSTGEPVTECSVMPGTTIYEGPYGRVAFDVITGVTFGTAYRTISWSVRYADNAGIEYETNCQATCYVDVSFEAGEVESHGLDLDRDSTAKERNARTLRDSTPGAP